MSEEATTPQPEVESTEPATSEENVNEDVEKNADGVIILRASANSPAPAYAQFEPVQKFDNADKSTTQTTFEKNEDYKPSYLQ